MFLAMNRFKVRPDAAADFEKVWRDRDSRLAELQGFVSFSLLRGPEAEDHVLYASHTIWRTREDFENWTKSEQFRAAHAGAGTAKPMYLGHPQFEGFQSVIELERADA
jgi:heme-degrading monooxygenase HmoA